MELELPEDVNSSHGSGLPVSVEQASSVNEHGFWYLAGT